ncbi:MAG: secretin and TonB N-terminal domain-containing protein [Verrucomicrobia bacterium]|nr:secretin and TonB N-terminal domain-containing protein [Verrucomicrobiota bacterium]
MRTHPVALLAALAALTVPLRAAVQANQPPAPPATANQPPAADKPAVPADAAAKLADKPAAPDVAVKTDEKAASTSTKSKDASGKDTLSVDFPDEDIRNILRNVADLFELNIIMPETLQGKTTIKLRDVTWRQIFQHVLDPVNYTYTEDSNIIKIVTKDSLNDEPVVTEIFPINYATAAAIMPTISTLVDPAKGKIQVETRTNVLVITERPTRLTRIRPIIEQLDRATDQVMIEAKFVEVTDRDVKNIGVNWASLANYSVAVSGDGKGGVVTSSFDRTRGQTGTSGVDTSNATGRNSTLNNVAGTTATGSVNNTNAQVSGSNTTSSVTNTNGTPTATSTTGSNGSNTTNATTTNTTGTNNAVTNTINDTLNLLNTITGGATNTDSTNRVLNAVFSASQFQLVLNALQTQNDVKIVSNPTIVTLNNTAATINVGQEEPIPKYQYNQQTGGFEVAGFEYKPVGINLKVTPQVNSRGSIKLAVEPEVSQTNGTRAFGPAQIPIVATRKAKTEISIQDGYTLGIGGLLTTQATKGQTRVPLLGSVPLLGRLFRNDTADAQSTNLVIFITAKTLSANGAPVEQVFNSERVRQLELRREDLPGYRDGSSPFLPSPNSPEAKAKAEAEAKKPLLQKLMGSGDKK